MIIPHKLSFVVVDGQNVINNICESIVEMLGAKSYELDGETDSITLKFEHNSVKFKYIKSTF